MKRKKLTNKLFAVVLVGAMLTSTSICALAHTGEYSGFILTYDCSVTKKKGTATTEGSKAPYYNGASVTIYADGVSKGCISAYKKDYEVTAKKTGKKLTSAKSCHFVTDSNYRHLEKFTKQLTDTATR